MKKSFAAKLKKRSGEKGIALLFTLGILGLLTVLALSFAASSMLERKASQYSAGASSARILAQSGLNRALAVMGFYMQYSDNYDVVVSKDPASSGTYDFIYRLNTDIDGVYYKIKASAYDASNNQCAQWVYVDNGKTGSDKELIGRFAYAVVACGGKLDPSACVDTGVNEKDFSFTTGITTGEPRIGVKVQEIPIPGLISGWTAWLSEANVNNMNYDGVGTGQLNPSGSRWTNYSTFFSEVLDPASTLDPVIKVKWEWDWFAVDDALEYDEAYWIDLNGDGKFDSTTGSDDERFPRFNLARTDWNGIGGTTVNTSAAVDYLRGKTIARDPFHTSNTANYIEWLKQDDCTGGPYSYSSSLPQETFSSSGARANQIAANILDYCDADSSATTDNNTWSGGDAPTYTGNEKTPYINELSIQVAASFVATPVADSEGDGVPNYSCSYSMTITIGAEIMNIFEEALTTSSMYIRSANSGGGDITMVVTYKEPGSSTDLTFNVPIDTSTTPITFVASANRYETASLLKTVAFPGSPFNANGSNKTLEITSVKIPAFNVYLVNGTDNYDYAKIQATDLTVTGSSAPLLLMSNLTSGTASINAIRDWQTDDPRQNLNYGDWTLSSPTANTVGAVNDTVTASSSVGDGEALAVSGKIMSTVYIRNAPMQSPWELGLIHRGKVWETINLREYNTSSGTALTMGAYSGTSSDPKGDANILDQVKMTSNAKTYGLINLKTANKEVLQTLFVGIPVNNDYANVATSSSDTITPTKAASIAGTVKDHMVGNAIKNRAQIANISGITNGNVVTQTDDATKEAIIGKMATLTRLEKAVVFKVIVVSQTLKDAGGPYLTNVLMNKDFNADGDSSDTIASGDSALVKLGYKDPSAISSEAEYGTIPTISESRNCQKGVYDVGFDEISGEQKIIATVKYDVSTSTWTIINYELVSE